MIILYLSIKKQVKAAVAVLKPTPVLIPTLLPMLTPAPNSPKPGNLGKNTEDAGRNTRNSDLNQWDASVALNPGNLLGNSAGTLEVLADYAKEIAPNEIRNITRPSNIGIGTWNKYIADEIQTATSEFGNVSKVSKIAGVASIGVDVGFGVYDNYQLYKEGKIDKVRIGTDAVVDTTSGLVGLGASIATGALAGSIVPGLGTLAGAAVGLTTGVVYMVGTEMWKPGGKSIENRAKDGLYNWWIKDNNDWNMPENSYDNSYYRMPTVMPQSR